VLLLGRAPHHVPVQGRQAEVDNLPEVLVDGVDAFLAGGSDSRPQVVNDVVDLGG
jgi:hypothetical protein